MSGEVVTKQYGQWKTQIKDVFNIRVVSGLKCKVFGLGPCSRLQAQEKPQREPLSGVVRSFRKAFGASEGGVTSMEEEHETTFLLGVGVSKKRRFMGKEADDQNIPKPKPHADQQFCEVSVTTCFDFGSSSLKGLHCGGSFPSVAVGKRKGVKVGGQRGRGSLPKPSALESVEDVSLRKTTGSTGKSVMGSGEWAHHEK
ncbi:unnamed protein product [Prunus armeniaca]